MRTEKLQLEELLAWLDRAQGHIVAALGCMDEAAWAREVTVGNNRKATVGQRVFFSVLSRNVPRRADGIVPANLPGRMITSYRHIQSDYARMFRHNGRSIDDSLGTM
jgi:hypothetical protein